MMSHDHDRDRGQQEKPGCCGGEKPQAQAQPRPKDEPKAEPRKHGCCG